GSGRRIEEAEPGASDVLSDERRAIAEGQVVSEREPIREPVVADLPARGQRGVRLSGLVEARQAGVELQDQLDIGSIGDVRRIERAGGSREEPKQRPGGPNRPTG